MDGRDEDVPGNIVYRRVGVNSDNVSIYGKYRIDGVSEKNGLHRLVRIGIGKSMVQYDVFSIDRERIKSILGD